MRWAAAFVLVGSVAGAQVNPGDGTRPIVTRIHVGANMPVYISDSSEVLDVAGGSLWVHGQASQVEKRERGVYLTSKKWDNLIGSYEREATSLVKRLNARGSRLSRTTPSHVDRLGNRRVQVLNGSTVHLVMMDGSVSMQETLVPAGTYLAWSDWESFVGGYEEELTVLRGLVDVVESKGRL